MMNVVEDSVVALIIAPPGRARASWGVLLHATHRFSAIRYADDNESGLRLMAQQSPEYYPGSLWVFLDSRLEEVLPITLAQVQAHWPQVKCLVLLHSVAHKDRVPLPPFVGILPADCSLEVLQRELSSMDSAHTYHPSDQRRPD